MLILSNGNVWLEEGELVPYPCECGHLYQPEKPNESHSICPKCGNLNDHNAEVFFNPAPLPMIPND